MASVTETAAAAIIEKLVNTVLDYASSSWWPGSRNVKAEAKKLQDALPQIRLMLGAVQGDRIRQRNPDFDARMWQFRDAIEAADDVLDEIEYYELEEKVKARNSEVSGSLSGYKRKLADFLSNAFDNGVLSKLREAVKGLEAIASDVGPFLQLASSLNEQLVVNDHFRETGSLLTETGVVGRENEKETIVQWLIARPDTNEQGMLSIFSIWGVGGMGKTTLAQLVCKDQRVIDNFELIVWVCVSDNSSIVPAKILIRKIIEAVTKQSCDLDNLSTVQNRLKEKITSKKFMLVLDDVWRDDTQSEWEKILAPLKFGERGSKIMLTTRMESVAKMVVGMMEGENKYLNLAGLEENDIVTLLYRHAFAGTDPSKHQYLHETGNEIAKKLWACPLAAKVIGGVLNKSLNFGFWNKILKEDILKIEASNDNIMEILKLSYYHLPTHLQLCFRYCSIFPQDHRFQKEELVKIWMGSGLIPQYEHEKRRPEDVAGEYLDQLTRKSFFNMKRYNEESYPVWSVYYIHDLLHDLSRDVSKGECLGVKRNDFIYIPRTTRHLSIEIENNSMLQEIRNLSKLQTLMITCINSDLDLEQVFNEILPKVKSLRLLRIALKTWQKIPIIIGDLKHLRYLSITWSRKMLISKDFFSSLNKLYHLQVINLNDYNISESELEGMCNLINLRYYTFGSSKSDTQIPGVWNLTSLQELNYFNAGKEGGTVIGKLKHLTGLRKLHIGDLNGVRNPDDAAKAEIYKKKDLYSLDLTWYNFFEVGDREEEVANNFKPHANLNKLKIYGYAGIRSPCWMNDASCCNLTSVQLSTCYRWEHLPPLGQLNSLKSLDLRNMYAVKQVGYSLYGNSSGCIFPSLRQLRFEDMPEWEEWTGVEDIIFPCLENLIIEKCPKLKRLPSGCRLFPSLRCLGFNEMLELEEWPGLDGELLFPCLHELIIRKCPKLKGLPTLPPSLRQLEITDTALGALPKVPAMLKSLKFGPCDDFESLFIRSLHDLTSLTELRLHGCVSLQSLAPYTEVFAQMTFLRMLGITSCKELESLNGIEVLTELRSLVVMGCDKLNELSLQQSPVLSQNDPLDLTSHHLNIHRLEIDCTSLLLMEPLRSCRFIISLKIDGDSQVISLPEQWLLQNRLSLETLVMYKAASLQSLPSCIENMCTLSWLNIEGCKMLKSLPNLPRSLENLFIKECHSELADLCQRPDSIYWSTTSHISHLYISER